MGENGMTKYVINTVEVVKRIYLADAYTEEEALKKQKVQSLNNGAEKVVELGELLYSIETINEYEYNKDWKPGLADKIDWKPETKQKDWVDQGRLGTTGDRLKGPALNVIEDDSYDLYRDD